MNGYAKWESFVIGLEKYEQVANLRNQGLNQQVIADQLGLSQGEVSKRLGTAANRVVCLCAFRSTLLHASSSSA